MVNYYNDIHDYIQEWTFSFQTWYNGNETLQGEGNRTEGEMDLFQNIPAL